MDAKAIKTVIAKSHKSKTTKEEMEESPGYREIGLP